MLAMDQLCLSDRVLFHQDVKISMRLFSQIFFILFLFDYLSYMKSSSDSTGNDECNNCFI